MIHRSDSDPAIAQGISLSEFGQHLGRVRIAGGCQPPKLFEIFFLSCKFHELILSVPTAAVGKAP